MKFPGLTSISHGLLWTGVLAQTAFAQSSGSLPAPTLPGGTSTASNDVFGAWSGIVKAGVEILLIILALAAIIGPGFLIIGAFKKAVDKQEWGHFVMVLIAGIIVMLFVLWVVVLGWEWKDRL